MTHGSLTLTVDSLTLDSQQLFHSLSSASHALAYSARVRRRGGLLLRRKAREENIQGSLRHCKDADAESCWVPPAAGCGGALCGIVLHAIQFNTFSCLPGGACVLGRPRLCA